jgi:hypothetical protein
MKRKLGLLVIAALAFVGVGLAASPAQAAPVAHASAAGSAAAYNPYVLCGPGYTLARSEGVVRFDDPVRVATFYLMYNPFLDRFCGVTIKSRFVGISTETMAGVGGASGTVIINSGPRLFFAGPVSDRPTVDASGRCVLYGASLTDPQGNTYFHATANPAIGWSRYCR